jgi:uncharacterized membrane protein YkgB
VLVGVGEGAASRGRFDDESGRRDETSSPRFMLSILPFFSFFFSSDDDDDDEEEEDDDEVDVDVEDEERSDNEVSAVLAPRGLIGTGLMSGVIVGFTSSSRDDVSVEEAS